MDRNLALEFVRITEAAAIASARWMGRGNKEAADQAAVDAMRRAFDSVDINGTVVIGEGERDEAPMLFIGEKVGRAPDWSPSVDIALDPLEGTNLCAKGAPGALAVIAIAQRGHFLHAPDTYMQKIAVGPATKGLVDLDATPEENVRAVAASLNKDVEDVTVVIMERERHLEIIERCRSIGARIQLITDGDVSACLATAMPDSGIDLFLGVGGSPEGVISAAALKCLGGDFQGRLRFRNPDEVKRAKRMGIDDPDRRYSLEELAKGDVMFCATGVTTGAMLRGVRFMQHHRASSHSVVMRSKSGTVRMIEALHRLDRKPLV